MASRTSTLPKKTSRWWSIIIGIGVALSPIHNQWLTRLTTLPSGEVWFFLPKFAYILIILGSGFFLLNNWRRVREVGWGDRRIVGCLFFIVLAISASGAAYSGLQDRFAPMGMGLALFALYLCGRVLGKDMFLPLAIGAVIASLGVIVSGVWHTGQLTGGLVFEANYDIVVGYILLGVVLSPQKWQLPLVALALVAMFLTGSPEAIFAAGVIGLVVLLRRDWSSRLVWTVAPLVLVTVVWFSSGFGQQLYSYTGKVIQNEPTVPASVENVGTPEQLESGDALLITERDVPKYGAMEHRVNVVKGVLVNIKPLGEGYNLTDFSRSRNVHNVPLVLVQQLGYPGILAAMAWLFVSIYCLVKTRWKYLFVLIFALSLFDHFIFTQLNSVWWIAVGVSTAPNSIKSDLVFKDA